MRIDIPLGQIEDDLVRESLATVKSELETSPVLKGTWRLMEVSFKAAGTFTVRHSLGFKPLDVILLSSSAGTATIAPANFTKESVTIQVSNPSTVRFFIGKAD